MTAPYAPPAPQRKKHTVRNVLLLVVLLMILVIGGCVALVGGAAKEIDDAIQEEERNDTPSEIEEGGAFTHDGYEVEAGWTVERDELGSVTIEGMRATNVTEEDGRTALLDLTFYRDNENLAEVTCTSNEMQAGESSRLDCLSLGTDFPRGYDRIQVADSF